MYRAKMSWKTDEYRIERRSMMLSEIVKNQKPGTIILVCVRRVGGEYPGDKWDRGRGESRAAAPL